MLSLGTVFPKRKEVLYMDNYNQNNGYQNPGDYQTPPNGYQQPMYQVPPQQPYYDPTSQVMSVGEYIRLFILSAIPIVNIICWIVWLCSPNTNKNKKNYIIANIIIWVVCMVVGIVVSFLVASTGAAAMALFY